MDFCWGGEGEAVFLESRQNSQQGTSTPVSSPAILCANELCISVHGSYASPRIANGKMDTLKKFSFSFATLFRQTFAHNHKYRCLVLELDQMKDAIRSCKEPRLW